MCMAVPLGSLERSLERLKESQERTHLETLSYFLHEHVSVRCKTIDGQYGLIGPGYRHDQERNSFSMAEARTI